MGLSSSRTEPAQRSGCAAEVAVVEYLRSQGFSLVATNLRVGMLEIDVVARREDLVVVVEVRTRGPGSWTTAFGSIDAAKRQRVRRAGERLWRTRYRADSTINRMRFDAASVSFDTDGRGRVEYSAGAF